MTRNIACFCLLLLAPTATLAAGGVFDVSGSDSSMQYLGAVFGQMGTLPIGSDGNPLFSEMLQIMNKIVFFLGIIIVLYTGTVSTIQTAQEGEVMGKKWSTIWVPVRAAFGLFLLVPSPGSGYSYIQIGIMYLIVQGVGAANAIWDRVLVSLAQGHTIVDITDADKAIADGKAVSQNFLTSELCAYLINSTDELSELIDFEPIEFFQSTSDPNTMMWGVEATNTPYCGYVKVPNVNSAIPDTLSGDSSAKLPLERLSRNMMVTISFSLLPLAEESLSNDDPDTWTTPANLSLVARTLNNGNLDIHNYYNSRRNDLTTILDFARLQGWIHAGSYYYTLVKGQAANLTVGDYSPTGYKGPNFKSLVGGDTDANNLDAKVNAKLTAIYKRAADMFGKKPTRTELLSTGVAGSNGGHLGPLTKFLRQMATDLIASMSGGTGYRDPLVPLSVTGQSIMNGVEIAFWVLVAVIPLLALASIPPCLNPIWGVITTVGLIVITIFMIIGPLLWTAGVILGLYAPMIPFLVYTFSAIAWIILVIEAIVAAPLVALILVVPSEDEMGKAGHSLVILLGLIFRPALMVVGFILGAKVLFVTAGMLDFGFKEYIMASIDGIGVFGAIAIVIIYCGVMITIVHQCFSLIYAIPDKVLRWMGGQAETSDVGSKVQQIRGSADKAGQVGGAMMKGGAAAAQKASKGGE